MYTNVSYTCRKLQLRVNEVTNDERREKKQNKTSENCCVCCFFFVNFFNEKYVSIGSVCTP